MQSTGCHPTWHWFRIHGFHQGNRHHSIGATGSKQPAIHVRSFAPAHGIPEDPVCGSGNISVAAYLRKAGQAGRFGERYVARQGMQLGRDGKVAIRFDGDEILLGGSAVTCIDGSLRLA